MIEALSQTVDVPLWLLLALAGYHRAFRMAGDALRERRRRKQTLRRETQKREETGS